MYALQLMNARGEYVTKYTFANFAEVAIFVAESNYLDGWRIVPAGSR